jgi:hypothetical protein
MKEKILKVAYEKGLYAQGTPDSWDEEALYEFGKYLIDECVDAISNTNVRFVATSYDKSIADSTKAIAIQNIHNKFKDENVQ